jgi:hypothetical protein
VFLKQEKTNIVFLKEKRNVKTKKRNLLLRRQIQKVARQKINTRQRHISLFSTAHKTKQKRAADLKQKQDLSKEKKLGHDVTRHRQ